MSVHVWPHNSRMHGLSMEMAEALADLFIVRYRWVRSARGDYRIWFVFRIDDEGFVAGMWTEDQFREMHSGFQIGGLDLGWCDWFLHHAKQRQLAKAVH